MADRTKIDPIQAEWIATRDRVVAGHPEAGLVALAAMNGVGALPPASQQHLSEHGCHVCEGLLIAAWAFRCPPRYLATVIVAMTPESSMQAALAQHAHGCENPSCLAALEAIEAAVVADAAPEVMPEAAPATRRSRVERGRAVLEEVGARLLESFMPRSPLPQLLSAEPEAPPAARAAGGRVLQFGDGITLSASATNPHAITLTVDFTTAPEVASAPAVVAVFDQNRTDVHVTEVFDDPQGVQRRDLEIEPEVLVTGELRVAFGDRDG